MRVAIELKPARAVLCCVLHYLDLTTRAAVRPTCRYMYAASFLPASVRQSVCVRLPNMNGVDTRRDFISGVSRLYTSNLSRLKFIYAGSEETRLHVDIGEHGLWRKELEMVCRDDITA
jgi:hypothetical protein